jgi:hypothetical protein
VGVSGSLLGRSNISVVIWATVGCRFRICSPSRPIEALFGTRVLVGISGDNLLEYWVKPLPLPNPPQNPTHNPLGRCRVLGIDKNTLKFGEKWGLVGIKLAQYSSTKHIFRSERGFGVWCGLSPLIPTKTLVSNKA